MNDPLPVKSRPGPPRFPRTRLLLVMLVGLVGMVLWWATPVRAPVLVGPKSRGSERARVLVREYGDFQCPACSAFHANIFPHLLQDYIETGKVRFEFHHFIIFAGDLSVRAAEASECAGEQDQFWPYFDLLYSDSPTEGVGRFTVTHLEGLAARTSMDTARFNTCLETSKYNQRVINAQIEANKLKLPGTPTIFVNEVQVSDPMDYSEIKAAIEEALK